MSIARTAPSVLPPQAVLEMTYRCNHKCLFCSCPWFADMIPCDEELGTGEWCELIETYCKLGVTGFSFTGGEALLKPELLKIIDFAGQCRALYLETVDGALTEYYAPPKMNLLSNGRAMSDEVLEICAKHQMNLSLSLPGLTTFNQNTGSDTGPGNVLKWFTRAKDFGVTTTVGIAVTKLNLDELYQTIAAALLSGADTLLLNRFLPGGRGLEHPELELTIEEVIDIADTAEEVLSVANRYGHFGTELPRCIIDPGKYTHLKIGTGCSAARQFFVVGPNGKLRGCNHSPIELCHWREHQTLAKNPHWRSWLFHELYPKHCGGCEYLSECAGGCREAARVKSGSATAPDPVFGEGDFSTTKARKTDF